MSKIIIFGNQKGGVGKSQCTAMAAVALSQAPFNLRVCIVDIDDQKSLVTARKLDQKAYGAGEPFPVLDYTVSQLQEEIVNLNRDYQVLFIDTPGRLDNRRDALNQEITKALMYADYLFMPFAGGNYNLESTLKYLHFVTQIKVARALSERQLQLYGFVNMFYQRSRHSASLLSDIRQLSDAGHLDFMRNPLNDYSLFADADTYTSLYSPDSADPAKVNFVLWMNEFCKLTGIR